MRLSSLIDFYVYDSAKATNDPANTTAIKNSVEVDGITTVSRNVLVIADSTSNQTITLPKATVKYLLIAIDRTVTIKLNGSSDAITLSPSANGKKTVAFYLKGTISSLTISNASGAAVNLDLITAD